MHHVCTYYTYCTLYTIYDVHDVCMSMYADDVHTVHYGVHLCTCARGRWKWEHEQWPVVSERGSAAPGNHCMPA